MVSHYHLSLCFCNALEDVSGDVFAADRVFSYTFLVASHLYTRIRLEMQDGLAHSPKSELEEYAY
jgi:hypothetical protein